MAAITKGLEGLEMTEIGLLKAAGAVAFTDGEKSVTNAQVMRRVLTYARDFDALIVHHTEDPHLVGDGVMNEGEFAARLGLLGIPCAAETVMLERDTRLVALTGGRYHAASVSCAAPRTTASTSPRRPRSITSRSTKTTSAPIAPS
jgi:dihydroorotase